MLRPLGAGGAGFDGASDLEQQDAAPPRAVIATLRLPGADAPKRKISDLGANDAFAFSGASHGGLGTGMLGTTPILGDTRSPARIAGLLVCFAIKSDERHARGRLDGARFQRGGDGNSRTAKEALRAHEWRHMLRFVRTLCLLALVALTLFEQPRWCAPNGHFEAKTCEQMFHTFGVAYMGRIPSLVVEACVVLFLMWDLWLWSIVRGWVGFTRWRSRIAHALALAALLVDILVSGLLYHWFPWSWRLAPYLRVFLLLSYNMGFHIGDTGDMFVSTGEFFKVLVPLAVIVLFFAWSGVVIWKNTPSEVQWWGDYRKALWSMTDLVTTNDFPDVMVDAVDTDRWSFLFFLCFLVMSIWLLLPAIMAVVYAGYLRQREDAGNVGDENKQALLDEAFTILDGAGRGAVGREQIGSLLSAVRLAGGPGSLDPLWQAVVFGILDRSGESAVGRSDFWELDKVLSIKLDRVQWPLLARFFPRLRKAVDSNLFEGCMDAAFVLNFFFAMRETWPLLVSVEPCPACNKGIVYEMPWVLLLLFEMLLKVLLFGWKTYWSKWRHWFDGLTTIVTITVTFVVLYPDTYDDPAPIQVALMIRSLRAARLFGAGPVFASLASSFKILLPGAMRVLPLMLIITLGFAVLGCDLMGGVITTIKTDSRYQILMTMQYGQDGYWPLNFNDVASGMLTLVSCLVINNADAYVQAFMAVGGGWTSIYFIVWFIVGVCGLLNLLCSVAIDAFVAQGALHEGSPGHVQHHFDASMITGTITGVQGTWRARCNLPGGGGPEAQQAAQEALEDLVRPTLRTEASLPELVRPPRPSRPSMPVWALLRESRPSAGASSRSIATSDRLSSAGAASIAAAPVINMAAGD